jgi:hypothetical protein
MSSPTLQTLQDPILRLPRLCFRVAAFQTLLLRIRSGDVRAQTRAKESAQDETLFKETYDVHRKQLGRGGIRIEGASTHGRRLRFDDTAFVTKPLK